jgi:hypothetical protein
MVTGTRQSSSAAARIEVIHMPWWETILFLIAVGVAIWGFISMVGVRTRFLTRKTTRSAQDLYGNYADSPRKQRRYAREHGGEWSDREDASSSIRSPRS